MKKKVLKEFTFEIDNFIKGHNNKIYKGHSNKIYITVLDYNMDGVRAQLMRKFGEIITYDILDGYAMSCYDDRLDKEIHKSARPKYDYINPTVCCAKMSEKDAHRLSRTKWESVTCKRCLKHRKSHKYNP